MTILVDCAAGTITIAGGRYSCAIGRSGAIAAGEKREGDGFTPLGEWPLRGVILRQGRGFSRPPMLPWRWSRPGDGWCDDPADGDYNRPVRLPRRGSSETLWRDDALYDAIVVIGYNDSPIVPGMGSAIFLHVRGHGPTEGCVAVTPDIMAAVLRDATRDTRLAIV